MSRIVRPKINDGDSISATTLNATYDDYTQPNALDGSNVRDQAFDLPHINSDVLTLVRSAPDTLIGTGTKAHPAATYNTVNALTAGAAVHVVSNGASVPTILNFSASPWVIPVGDCLRVWWNLSVETVYGGLPWKFPGILGDYESYENISALTVNDGFHCWIAYLQWDVTSASLTNFVAVPGQMDILSPLGSSSYNGMYVHQMNGSTVISPWQITSSGSGRDGKHPTDAWSAEDHLWFSPYGMFVHAPTQQVTVYGVRLVIAGLFHIGHFTATSEPNVMVLDYAAGKDGANVVSLHYTSGRMSAVQMRMG
jgi:hypothetical protein